MAASLTAQGFTYSPSVAPVQGGNANDASPLSSVAYSYQQVHADVRGAPRVIQELAWRRAGTAPLPGAVARTADCDLWIGYGDYATSSEVFANNFVSVPVNVIARRMLSFPDNTAPNTNPPQFNVALPFDVPWPYSGAQDLTWKVDAFFTRPQGTYLLDAQDGSAVGAEVLTGTGCLVPSRPNPMEQSAVIRAVAWNDTLQLSWSFRNGPFTNGSAAMFIGTTSADLPVPGLCTNFYVGTPAITISGFGILNGVFQTPISTIPNQPAYLGLQLHSQGAAVMFGGPGIPLVLTNRNTATVPAPPAVTARARRIHSDILQRTGRTDGWPFWLVTRFRH